MASAARALPPIVMDDQGTVGASADIQFHAVGAQSAGLVEGLDGVFRLDGGCTPMGQHGDHAIFSQVFRNEFLAILGLGLYDLTYMR